MRRWNTLLEDVRAELAGVREVVGRVARGEKVDEVYWFRAVDLWELREFEWSKETARNGFARVEGHYVWLDGMVKWDAIVEDLKENGWDDREPLYVRVGKNGKALVGDGNHRLAIARELGLRVPVSFQLEPKV